MTNKLQTAIEAAKLGGEIALAYFNKDLGIQIKDDKTIVTKADKEVEHEIMQYISSKFPKAKFVGEESGGDRKEKSFWIIDPIDGTRSFVRNIPTWDVLIAYCENGEIVLGVAYFPVLNTIAWAEKGKGAFVDGKQIHVSNIDQLNKSFLGFGHIKSYSPEIIVNLIKNSWNVRNMAGYTAYLVAKGSMEVYIAPSNKVWDFAPYKILIDEAGGKLTKLDGTTWDFETVGGILSNGLVHDEVVEIINKK